MFGQFLFRPIKGPKWARLDRLSQWKDEAQQSPLWCAYAHFARQVPFWKKIREMVFLALCFLAIMAVFWPLLFPSHSRVCLVLAALSIAGFGVHGILYWILRKQGWLGFVVWARKDQEFFGTIKMTAEVVGPSAFLTMETIGRDLFCVFSTALAGLFVPYVTAWRDIELVVLFVWLYTVMACIMAAPVIVPALVLMEATWWWLFSKHVASLFSYVLSFLAAVLFIVAYGVFIVKGFAVLDRWDNSRFQIIAFTAFLGFVIPLVGGIMWWLALWISQKLFGLCEDVLKERFGIATCHQNLPV